MKLAIAFFFLAMTNAQPLQAGVQGFLPVPAAVADFHDGFATIPACGTTATTGQQDIGNLQVYGDVIDDRTGSPTYGDMIEIEQDEPQYLQTWTPVALPYLTLPTIALPVASGLKHHRLFAYSLLNPQVFESAIFYTPECQSVGTLPPGLNITYVWNGQVNTVLALGSLSGVVKAWLGGQCVGKMPFNIYTPTAGQSAASVIFDATLGAGTIKSIKGGGLSVLTPFDGQARSLPVIDFVGNCDTVTVDATLYKIFTAGGGLYAAILSTL